MINVLHLINYPGKGGSEGYILSLAEKLHGGECKFSLAYSMDGPMLKQAEAMGIATYNIPMKSPWDIKAASNVKKLCRELSIDVIHTHFLRENFVSVFSRFLGCRAALVNAVHMLDERTGVIKLANRFFSSFDDGIIAVSNSVRNILLSEGINSSKIRLIFNGVDIDVRCEKNNEGIREALGIKAGEYVITSAARFSEEKGHFFLLDAINYFKRTYKQGNDGNTPRVRFILAGDGVLLDECKKRADSLGIAEDIIFSGFCSDVNSLLGASDLFISHSIREAMGISILEALACGLPVVAINSGGPGEIVNDDTGCGILVEKGDAAGFAAAMSRMVRDREFYDFCRSRALITVKDMFNLDETAGATLDFYIECMKR